MDADKCSFILCPFTVLDARCLFVEFGAKQAK